MHLVIVAFRNAEIMYITKIKSRAYLIHIILSAKLNLCKRFTLH